jgi:beta-lactam-binding protein with PASTA domain
VSQETNSTSAYEATGTPTYRVPPVADLPIPEASKRLADARFAEGGDVLRAAREQSRWRVIGSDPPEGTELPAGAQVNLVLRAELADDRFTFDGTIPNVAGLPVGEAADQLRGLGYTLSFVEHCANDVPDEHVIITTPSIGTFLLPPGHVQVDYSTGPCPPPDPIPPHHDDKPIIPGGI